MSTEENKLTAEAATNETNINDAASSAAATRTATDAFPSTANQSSANHGNATNASATPQPSAAANQAMNSDDDADNADDNAGEMESMDFGAILEQFEQEQEQSAMMEGEVVGGKVVSLNDKGVMVDFGFKSEGLIPREDFGAEEITLQPGEEIEVLVKSIDSPEGFPILSHADALRLRSWDALEKAANDNTPVKGKVIERVKGGLRVDVGGVQAFLPGSQIDVRPIRNLDVFLNEEIEARVIKINRKRSNVVLSRKALVEEDVTERKGETLSHLEEGIIVEGQIKNLTDYGAFVDLGGLDGLLHVTDMSWGRLNYPGELFKVGDDVQVKVLKFDKEKERVSLGYKQLLPDPWESAEERYEKNSKIMGKVASVTDYGAFIELEPGVEGLVHVSEMSWSKRMKHPSKLVNPGETVEVQVLGVDPRARRISLGMKQMAQNPWETLPERYKVGARVQGRVRNLTDFGAFIEVEDGVDGLVHVSDISWAKRIKHPAEVLKKGQEIEAVITNIDIENHRLSLSIKDIEPSAWDQFTASYKPGDMVKGKITRFANFGVFVELADGLEGLCHVSELSDERVEKPEDAVKTGDEMEFRILRIESESHKIGLSARASAREEAVAETSKNYSTERGGGMASLGELADFFNRSSDTDVNQSDETANQSPETSR